MTVTYSLECSSSNLTTFLRLLLRWRGSIYKLLFKEIIVYLCVYFLLSFIYRITLNDDQKLLFEGLALFCEKYLSYIPLNFVLGFYVSTVVTRWWNVFNALAWVDRCRYHFTCSRCNVTLRGDKYNVLENKHFCIECFDFIRPRCDKCKKAIQTKQEYVKYDDDQVFHKECFLCYDCSQPLNPDAFVVEKDAFLCEQCSIDRHGDKKAKKDGKKAGRTVKA
uniref:Bestrophin homolog n=1 Tax=Romanomermis culicivorax TaxID=13658 RepID=A0A915KQP8_ROMCU